MKAEECRKLALDAIDGLNYEDEADEFLSAIYLVINDFAMNGAFQVGINFNQDDNIGVYDIQIPLYINEESATKFVNNIFKYVKGDLTLKGFQVIKLTNSKVLKNNHYKCNYSLVVGW